MDTEVVEPLDSLPRGAHFAPLCSDEPFGMVLGKEAKYFESQQTRANLESVASLPEVKALWCFNCVVSLPPDCGAFDLFQWREGAGLIGRVPVDPQSC